MGPRYQCVLRCEIGKRTEGRRLRPPRSLPNSATIYPLVRTAILKPRGAAALTRHPMRSQENPEGPNTKDSPTSPLATKPFRRTPPSSNHVVLSWVLNSFGISVWVYQYMNLLRTHQKETGDMQGVGVSITKLRKNV